MTSRLQRCVTRFARDLVVYITITMLIPINGARGRSTSLSMIIIECERPLQLIERLIEGDIRHGNRSVFFTDLRLQRVGLGGFFIMM